MTILFLDPQYKAEWDSELRAVGVWSERSRWLDENESVLLVETDDPRLRELIWVRDVWPEARVESITSIGHARRILLPKARKWAHVSVRCHRRGELIASELGTKPPSALQGWPTDPSQRDRIMRSGFLLAGEGELIWCLRPREIFPGGDWRFKETKEPPSRAYLKLWEWGWRSSTRPRPGMTALDLGAHPGGWSWVLANQGLHVTAIDRTPFESELVPPGDAGVQVGRVRFERDDVFRCVPKRFSQTFDWVFCDVVAEPEKTLDLFSCWREDTRAGLCFTIKFKGEDGQRSALIDRIKGWTGVQVAHLSVNKHEITVWRDSAVSV